MKCYIDIFDMKDKNSDALAIMPPIITILIIMFFILQQNEIAQGQNNNDKLVIVQSTRDSKIITSFSAP
jgi:hypothetical protein